MSNQRKRMVGKVIRTSSEKTVMVQVDRTYRHQLYQKVLRSRTKYMVHDEQGVQIGDQVRIVESRPISKRKRWVIEEVIQQAK